MSRQSMCLSAPLQKVIDDCRPFLMTNPIFGPTIFQLDEYLVTNKVPYRLSTHGLVRVCARYQKRPMAKAFSILP